MSKYFLAIDIGASSGRHMLGSLEDGKIVLEEVYRFWNGMDHVDGTLCWDVDRLFNEIIAGMKKCKEIGKVPVSVGIDTWGVDYVLLDKDDNIVGPTVGYRDHRTEGMAEEVYKIISEDDLYARTGIFQKIEMPGTAIGNLTDEVKELVGYDCQVVLPPTHDTASAVMAIPTNAEDTCYISSGTWSLMGVEMAEANCSPKSKEANFTNEGGYGGKITYLANIMGLWMIQSVRNQLAPDMSYGDLCEQASHETIKTVVDCQDASFLSPDDMVEAVKDYCRKTNQEVPETLPALASVIYNSLAKCYAEKLEEIQKITGVKYDKINIIGGGSNAAYLNELTAKYTGVGVHAGPGEATAIGNILSQMLEEGTFADLKDARNCVAKSFEIKVY